MPGRHRQSAPTVAGHRDIPTALAWCTTSAMGRRAGRTTAEGARRRRPDYRIRQARPAAPSRWCRRRALAFPARLTGSPGALPDMVGRWLPEAVLMSARQTRRSDRNNESGADGRFEGGGMVGRWNQTCGGTPTPAAQTRVTSRTSDAGSFTSNPGPLTACKCGSWRAVQLVQERAGGDAATVVKGGDRVGPRQRSRTVLGRSRG